MLVDCLCVSPAEASCVRGICSMMAALANAIRADASFIKTKLFRPPSRRASTQKRMFCPDAGKAGQLLTDPLTE